MAALWAQIISRKRSWGILRFQQLYPFDSAFDPMFDNATVGFQVRDSDDKPLLVAGIREFSEGFN